MSSAASPRSAATAARLEDETRRMERKLIALRAAMETEKAKRASLFKAQRRSKGAAPAKGVWKAAAPVAGTKRYKEAIVDRVRRADERRRTLKARGRQSAGPRRRRPVEGGSAAPAAPAAAPAAKPEGCPRPGSRASLPPRAASPPAYEPPVSRPQSRADPEFVAARAAFLAPPELEPAAAKPGPEAAAAPAPAPAPQAEPKGGSLLDGEYVEEANWFAEARQQWLGTAAAPAAEGAKPLAERLDELWGGEVDEAANQRDFQAAREKWLAETRAASSWNLEASQRCATPAFLRQMRGEEEEEEAAAAGVAAGPEEAEGAKAGCYHCLRLFYASRGAACDAAPGKAFCSDGCAEQHRAELCVACAACGAGVSRAEASRDAADLRWRCAPCHAHARAEEQAVAEAEVEAQAEAEATRRARSAESARRAASGPVVVLADSESESESESEDSL